MIRIRNTSMCSVHTLYRFAGQREVLLAGQSRKKNNEIKNKAGYFWSPIYLETEHRPGVPPEGVDGLDVEGRRLLAGGRLLQVPHLQRLHRFKDFKKTLL